MTLPLLYAIDTLSVEHRAHGYHPERPERLEAATRGLQAVRAERRELAQRAARREDLERVHDAEFVTEFFGHDKQTLRLDGDTFVVPGSVTAALAAAGAGLEAVDAILRGEGDKAAVLVRPPGHHAERARAMGFCLLNNAALVAAHARAHGFRRVAIVDYDVHHGNGTQDIFAERDDVLFVSLHQYPFYPGTGSVHEVGTDAGLGYTLNVPLEAGGGDSVYRAAFERVVVPALSQYAPDLVVVSAGFDAALHDPLAEMRLSTEAFRWMTNQLAQVAERTADDRMVMLLEGGYDMPSLEAGVTAAIEGMLGDPGTMPEAEITADVHLARRSLKQYWSI